jgi:polysaccharide lyase-like protein
VDAFGQISDRWRKPLYDGFEAKGFSASGGLYFKRSPEQEAGIVEFQSQVTYRGNGALKLSLRAGREETPQSSQRAEIWERPDLWVPYNEGIWYGFAVKFAEPIPQDDHRYVIAQWKREIAGTQGDFSPFLALRLNRGKLFATVETNLVKTTRAASQGQTTHCEAGETAVWLRPETNQTRALVATDALWTSDDGKRFSACTSDIVAIKRGNSLPTPASGWIDFVIYSKPGPDGTGQIEIFANDKWIVTVKGRIGHSDKGLGQFQYFKFGPYRAPHHDSWTLYYDEFRRSVNRADVFKNAS